MKTRLRLTVASLLSILYLVSLSACSDKDPYISILASSDVFYQTSSVNNKLDVLFVVDNSGSMSDEQSNLATNFNSFMSNFMSKGFDYRIAVTTTDAYLTQYGTSCNVGTTGYGGSVMAPCAKFKDGVGASSQHSGIFIIDNNTPNPLDVFSLNVKVGINGSADERAFQSFMNALDYNYAPNNTFLRPDSFLAIIIISDEDDFSRTGQSTSYGYDSYTQYDNPSNPYTIANVISYLDTKTSSTPTNRRYNVSTIGALAGSGCNPGQGHLGIRYEQLTLATDGVWGDVCAPDFSSDLSNIQNKIAELSTQFYLTRVPVVSSIVVRVDGVLVLQNAINGWTYNPTANSIVFHGTAIPSQGAQIFIDFDPISLD